MPSKDESLMLELQHDLQSKLEESVTLADGALMAHLARIEKEGQEAKKRDLTAVAHCDFLSQLSLIKDLKSTDYTVKGVIQSYKIGEGDAVVVVSGSSTVADVVLTVLEGRIGEVVKARRRVVAIEVRDSLIKSLADSVCGIFTPKIEGLSSLSSSAALGVEAMSLLLESQLRHLTVTCTNIQLFEPSVNRFDKLLTLDLSKNQIVKITDQISLPLLQHLDLSNNLLYSIAFLEDLRSLKSLNLSANCVTVLEGSVSNLIPLARTLKRFDMTRNAVSFLHNIFFSIY